MVTATRLPQPGFDLPASIDAIAARVIREDNPQVNLSETLNRVPGIVVQNRQNYAQDLQVSSRGFGARSTFGVRGVRLIADGIPATMPDGQGQASTFDLASAERIEVLRGPFASLYGNSSGGVVQVFTADGPECPTVDLGLMAGSYGQWRAGVRAGGTFGPLNVLASASRFETDGYRDHSAAERDQLNAKAKLALARGTVTFIANALRQPAQDPLGLTRAQFEADPRQADAAATLFNTRKTVRQSQGGIVYDVDVGPRDALQGRVYLGDRQVVQYLAQTGDTPLGSGGVVDLDRTYGGAGLRWTHRWGAPASPFTLSVGADYDTLEERRRGYVNNFGVQGALRRDEDDSVSNSDFYAQAEWEPSPEWVVSAGVRRSTVRFKVEDHFFTPANPDDSGSVRHAQTTPAFGIVLKASPDLRVYANAGEGFETPTFAELAYRPGGASGPNFELRPARSRHAEAGVKARLAPGTTLNIAAFRIDTRDEIVTNTSAGGRTDFKNASRTRRDGLEASLAATLGGGWEATLAYTILDARFTEPFSSGSPPSVVPAGRRLPGVPHSSAFGELLWRRGGLHAAAEVRYVGRVPVNDANSDFAPEYTVINLRAGFEQRVGGWKLREFVRVDNIADRHYAGSVIVAEARGRFFEPAPGRNFMAGIEASRTF